MMLDICILEKKGDREENREREEVNAKKATWFLNGKNLKIYAGDRKELRVLVAFWYRLFL